MNSRKKKRFGIEGTRLGWISVVLNIMLFVLKYAAGIVSGSVALIADAWHTLSDSLSSIVMIAGIKIARKPPDEKHPFGHGRAERIATMMIGFFLLIVAYEFIRESVGRLTSHQTYHYGILAWVATLVSIIVKEVLARLSFRAAKKTGLKSLKADGWHHRTDALSSVIVLIGLYFGSRFWWVDGVLGILVSVMICVAGYEVLKEAFSNLLGEKPDEETIRKIFEIVVQQCNEKVHLHQIRIHEYGQHREMTAHIKLQGQMSLEQAHKVATNIEQIVYKELNISAEIHVEPIEQEK